MPKKEELSNEEKCPFCKTSKNVFYDSKGGYLGEHIYYCKKCKEYFLVRDDPEEVIKQLSGEESFPQN